MVVSLALVLSPCSLTAGGSETSEVCFVGEPRMGAGVQLFDGKLLDADGDGELDFVAVPLDRPELFIMYGHGDGIWSDYVPVPTDMDARSFRAVDLDGDGRIDFVIPGERNGPTSIACVRASGPRSYEAPRFTEVPREASEVGTADFNGDGIVDLAALFQGSGHDASVSVFIGTGDLSFHASASFDCGNGNSRIGTGRIDGDAFPDIAVARFPERLVSVFFGDGTGAFPRVATIDATIDSITMALDDIDRDGFLDIVTSDDYELDLVVLWGDAAGTFARADRLPVGTTARSIAIVDIDGDSWPEIVLGGERDSRVGGIDLTMLSSVNGEIIPQSLTTIPTGYRPEYLAAGDIDGDGRQDVVAHGFMNITTHRGNDRGGLDGPRRFPGPLLPNVFEVADFDGDGVLDVAAGGKAGGASSAGALKLLRGNREGSFEAAADVRLRSDPTRLFVGDFDGDGALDVLCGYRSHQLPQLIEGRGGFAFDPVRDVSFDGLEDLRILAVAGIREDACTDAIASYAVDTPEGPILHPLVPLLGTTGGGFVLGPVFFTTESSYAVALGDLNGDLHNDIVCSRGAEVCFFHGAGDGTFAQVGSPLVIASPPSQFVIEDFTGDGVADVACLVPDRREVLLLRGTQGGSFEPGESLATGYDPADMAAADLNGDRRVDLLVANSGSDDVSVFVQSEDGMLVAARPVLTGVGPRGVRAADLEGRDEREILTINRTSSDVSILASCAKSPGNQFRRGDANVDGEIDIGDAIRVLYYLFGRLPISCVSAADANDDGVVDSSDALYLLNYVFNWGPAIPTPSSECGSDRTADTLTCESFGGLCPP